jgi:hypothetical protein
MKALKKHTEHKPKLDARQEMFLSYYLDPYSSTFANAYQSALQAGYNKHYSRNITSKGVNWLSDYVDKSELKLDHINRTLTELASFSRQVDSKSPDDTRIKALELLSKLNGLLVERKQVQSVVKVELGTGNRTIIEQETEQTPNT